jgi:hypothetical protein
MTDFFKYALKQVECKALVTPETFNQFLDEYALIPSQLHHKFFNFAVLNLRLQRSIQTGGGPHHNQLCIEENAAFCGLLDIMPN